MLFRRSTRFRMPPSSSLPPGVRGPRGREPADGPLGRALAEPPAPEGAPHPEGSPDARIVVDETHVPRERGLPKGALVVVDALTHEGIRRGSRTATSLSDAVVRPALHCYVASLSGTLAYFGDAQALHANATRVLRETHGASVGPGPGAAHTPTQAHAPSPPPGVRVVFGRHTMRTYLFACGTHGAPGPSGSLGASGNATSTGGAAPTASEGRHVAFADSLHLGYRRFKEGLGWEEWRVGVLQFCALLRYSISERARLATELARFVRHMRQMRYEGPFAVPRALPSEDFARRFGRLVAELWEHWRLEDDGFVPPRPWRAEPPDLDPSAFVTHHWETPEWENALALSPERVEAVLRATFEILLFKARACDLPGRRHGIRDVNVRLLFNDGVELVYEARLARAAHEPGRLFDLLVSDVCARLPLGEKEHVSPRDPSWVVTLHTLHQLTLEPLGIACILEAPSEDLFAAVRPVALDEVCFSLRLRSARWNLGRYGLRTSLAPHGAFTREEAGAFTHAPGDATGAYPDDAGALFALVHHARPSALLRQPRPVDLAALRLRTIEYAETVGEEDFFVGVPRVPDSPHLWLSSPVSARVLPAAERPWSLVGAFS